MFNDFLQGLEDSVMPPGPRLGNIPKRRGSELVPVNAPARGIGPTVVHKCTVLGHGKLRHCKAVKSEIGELLPAVTDSAPAFAKEDKGYRENFKLVHPMIDAMRRKDPAALSMFEDIKLPQTSRMLDDLSLRQQVQAAQAATPERKESEVAVRVQEVLVLSGVPSDTAAALAAKAAQEETGSLLEASKSALAQATPARPVRSRPTPEGKHAPKAPTYSGLEERQSDFRNAIVSAFRNGSSISKEMQALGFLPQAQEVICLGVISLSVQKARLRSKG